MFKHDDFSWSGCPRKPLLRWWSNFNTRSVEIKAEISDAFLQDSSLLNSHSYTVSLVYSQLRMPSDITGYLQGRALIRKVPSYYTSEQAWQYLDRVGWVEGDYSVEDIETGRFPANLENLNIIIRRHYINFANDTTLMHLWVLMKSSHNLILLDICWQTPRSESHYLDISPEATFKRLVADRAGGTYCYGHHTLMLGVLRALGYRYVIFNLS